MILSFTICISAGTNDKGPDTINTLGVGSRAIGMGGAFVAVADDASATFWNPARLGQLPGTEGMIQFRQMTQTAEVKGIPFGDPWNTGNIETSGTKTGALRLNFAGLTYGIEKGGYVPSIGTTSGTIGLSWTMGGLFDYRFRANENYKQAYNTRVQNNFATLAWGKNFVYKRMKALKKPVQVGDAVPMGKIGFGIGAMQVTQDHDEIQSLPPIGDGIIESTRSTAHGTGTGYIIGVTMENWGKAKLQQDKTWETNPYSSDVGRWRYAASYRPKVTIKKMNDIANSFGPEVPSRLAVGAAYEWTESNKSIGNSNRAPLQLTLASEIQLFGAANKGGGYQDERKQVANFHIGAEIIPGKPWLPIPFLKKYTEDGTKLAYVEPIRVGFHTNKAANTDLFRDDYVLSLGAALYYSPIVGAGRGMWDSRFEPTLEYFTKSKITVFNLSSSYRF